MTGVEPYNHLTDPRRKGRVTASLVGAILGNNPYMTRDDAMRSMVRDALGAETEFTGNIATNYGNAHEDGAIMEFAMETGLQTSKAEFQTFEDWAGCSPDAWVAGDNSPEDSGLEAKCPFSLRNAEAPVPFKTLEEQPHYLDQVQFSLAVTGKSQWYFTQWAPKGLVWVKVVPDLEWQAYAMPRLRQFHAQFLDELKSPEDHLAPKRVIIDTPEAARAVKEWDDLREQEDRVKERKADLLKEMVAMAGGKNALFGGRKLTLTRREGAVSYASAVKALAPDADLEKWRGRASESWGLR